ncbi:DedA family protein [Bacillus sp. 31A1R]|uniref:DedA family protein n=1 Tax=Robertmurraya mangrovi TaxID=3098077 RepID=A0ABU5IWR2_9BACI|nr:DedA family protein [Bacillus sp. 31A1R]MDZ5471590.1 DedA family protein [Bacillus sp. 31A1R]
MEFWSDIILHYGYVGIVILMAAGIVGLPVPDEVLLTFIGYNIYLGKLNYTIALFASLLGAMTGITLSYFLGLKLGLPFLTKYGPRIFITEQKIANTQRLFNKWGPILLFFGYFLPGVRHITAYLAGISMFRFSKFSIYAYLGAIFWVLFFLTLGQQLGKRWYIVAQMAVQHGRLTLIIGIPIIIIIILFLLYRNKRKKS